MLPFVAFLWLCRPPVEMQRQGMKQLAPSVQCVLLEWPCLEVLKSLSRADSVLPDSMHSFDIKKSLTKDTGCQIHLSNDFCLKMYTPFNKWIDVFLFSKCLCMDQTISQNVSKDHILTVIHVLSFLLEMCQSWRLKYHDFSLRMDYHVWE